MTDTPINLPLSMYPPTSGDSNRCVVLADGEHYPAAVKDAIEVLSAAGWEVRSVALVGGGEKLREEPDYGVQHVRPPTSDPTPAGAMRSAIKLAGSDITTVVDLADEPVLVLERRFELISIAAQQGLRYVTADTVVEPPHFARIQAPVFSIIGTGKRIGKTAVSAFTARAINQYLGGDQSVVVVAMGRGGPSEPVVVSSSDGEVTVDRLLEISRAGAHAASDYLEGAVLTGLTTVGCRRVSGGLLGVPARSNVAQGAAVAARQVPAPKLVLLEGSGSCIPPVKADATLLLATTDRPQDLLEGFGAYRLALADVLLIMGNDADEAKELAKKAYKASGNKDLICVTASLVPTPVSDISGRKVAAFTTAPESVSPLIERELSHAGAEVLLVSCALAKRDQLAQHLKTAIELGADAFVVEIKAAAIDAVAESAKANGIDVVFLDNVPRSHEDAVDLQQLVNQLAQKALETKQ